MKYLRRDVHDLAVHYGLCTDEATFNKEMKRMKVIEPPVWLRPRNAACMHKFEYGPKKVAIVCMAQRLDCNLEQHYCLLVHEAVHVWQWHRELIGEREPSHEFEAYAIQSIAQCLISAFRDRKKKKR